MKIEGRTFLISGGASGLGAATATEIVNHGGNAAILDMNVEDGQAFAQSLGPSARFFPCNVRKSLVGATEFPRRPGQPEEFAALVRHVVENVMLNGTVLRLDGGMRMPSKM
ncbi:Nitronate monooxygenase [Verticillium dahliae VDG1]|nr:Nitronate monooxygenase [Verticillium dahliae VDG1]